MQNAAARMQTLITDLLSFSRVTNRDDPFVQADLSKLLKTVLSDLEIRIEQTCANITIDKLDTLEVDKSQMKQLFQNLISNALKFHRPDIPPEIKITGQVQPAEDDEAGAHYKITVSDNGIGFDMQYSERIFTVFQRLHGRSDYEGTGVGLAICRRIARIISFECKMQLPACKP